MALLLSNPTVMAIGLVVFAAIILIHFAGYRLVRKRAIAFGNFDTLEKAAGGKLLSRNFQMLAIRLLALFFLLLAMAGASIVYDREERLSSVVLTVDTSLTMTSPDYEPSRLEAAKNGLLRLVEKLPASTKMGVVSFADRANVVLGMTDDKRLVKNAIKRLDISPRAGTAIGNAIVTSADLSEKGGIDVLLTDGNNNAGVAIKEGLRNALERNITIFTIGIGDPAPENPERLDEETLMMISNVTSGEYFRAIDENAISNITSYLADKVIIRKLDSLDISFHLLLIAFAILVLEWFLMNTRYRTIP